MVDASGNIDREQWEQPLVELAERGLGPSVAPQLANGLMAPNIVRYLGLRGNNLGDSGVSTIADALKDNITLEILDLSENRIADSGAIALARLLEKNPGVQSIILNGNKIKKLGGEALAGALASNRKLKKLNLDNNKLRCVGATAFAKALETNRTLLHLSLSRNEINVSGGQALAKMLAVNETLQTLCISYNMIGAAVVDYGQALTQNHNLMELDIQSNLIDFGHSADFGEHLYQINLRTFNISNNSVGDQGAKAILENFSEQSNIRFLDMADTGLTVKSMDLVARVIRICPYLETLHVDGNNIGSEGVSLLAAALKETHAISAINIDRCGMDTPSLVALSLALYSSPKFCGVSVSGNHITDEGCRSLVDVFCYALKRMTLLKTLDLSRNSITKALIYELAAIFVNNTGLNSIQLAGNPVSVDLVNGILSRREALRILDSLADPSTVVVPPVNPASPASHRYKQGLPSIRGSSPSSVLMSQSTLVADSMGITWPVKPASCLTPSRGALVEVGTGTSKRSRIAAAGDSRLISFETLAELAEDEASRQNHTYPPLIPSKTSLEHPYYPGFGKGRFSNSSLCQTMGGLPHSIYNSRGFEMLQKWSDSIPTSETFFASGLRRAPKAYAYSESVLEANIGGLLVTERQLRQAFNELDVDGTGWLDRKEFVRLFRTFENFGVHTSEARVKEVLQRYKMWDDGKISFDEFCLLMLTVAQR